MELELKHLAGYLPYGVKVAYLRRAIGSSEILEIIPSQQIDAIYTQYNGVEIHTEPYSKRAFLIDYKLQLHPLSSLTKEIEVDGRSFIPIIELARLENGGGIFDYQIEKLFILDFGGSIGLYYTSSAGLVEFSYDPEFMTFTMMLRHKDESYKCDLTVNHQLKMFQKLFEWHFDVFGLIGKGLAINMEEL